MRHNSLYKLILPYSSSSISIMRQPLLCLGTVCAMDDKKGWRRSNKFCPSSMNFPFNSTYILFHTHFYIFESECLNFIAKPGTIIWIHSVFIMYYLIFNIKRDKASLSTLFNNASFIYFGSYTVSHNLVNRQKSRNISKVRIVVAYTSNALRTTKFEPFST